MVGYKKKKLSCKKLGRDFLIVSLIGLAIMGIMIMQHYFSSSVNWDNPTSLQNFLYIASKPEPTPTPHPAEMEAKKLAGQLKDQEALETENANLVSLVSRGNARKTKPILDYDKLKCPRYLVELMERMSAAHGFQTIATTYCISSYESKFDPTCWNQKGEDSRGLLQVNVADPWHRKRNPNKTKLFDAAYNLDYQLDELKVYYDQGKSQGLTGADLICYVAKNGQRPKWTQDIVNQIKKSYKEYLAAVVKE